MTFNDDAKIDSSRVSRRGRGALIGGGGGIGVAIVVFLIAQFTGVDLSGVTGGQASSGPDSAIPNCTTGEQANDSVDCLLAASADSLDTYWTSRFDSGYRSTNVILFDGQTSTGCGTASTDVGPFYCPPDEKIYIDTAFYQDLRTKYGSSGGPLAEEYVLAHEWGHHIQNLEGTMDGLDQSGTGPTSDSVRLELQADCYAGSWVGAASTTKDADGTTFLQAVTDAQITDALSAAAAVGDDRLQQQYQGSVDRDTWTHGSSASRQKWFSAGLKGGTAACNTFSVATP
ncbi:neutral zinc metallopeptidase [soil metagenome]